MESLLPSTGPLVSEQAGSVAQSAPSISEQQVETAKEFEKLLWAEMLKHTGLEEALTMNGGEGASAFSRLVVESIAEDLAEQRPFGFAEQIFSQSLDETRKVLE